MEGAIARAQLGQAATLLIHDPDNGPVEGHWSRKISNRKGTLNFSVNYPQCRRSVIQGIGNPDFAAVEQNAVKAPLPTGKGSARSAVARLESGDRAALGVCDPNIGSIEANPFGKGPTGKLWMEFGSSGR